jgi:sugar phosphate isomerase/epimerase
MLSITNLSWDVSDEEQIFNFLLDNSIKNIELSLTKKFGDWNNITELSLKKYKNYLKNNYDIKINSLQSLFYNIPYNLFDNNSEFKSHFKKIINFADALEANYLVFGSPKNRKTNGKCINECNQIFLETFTELANYNKNIFIGIEPNPRYYNCEYLINYSEVSKIVKTINHPKIVPHLDFACVSLENEDYEYIYDSEKNKLMLIHVSVKDLKNINNDVKINKFFSKNSINEKNFSIEMSNQSKKDIFDSIKYVLRCK